jgi:hypothetical protein
MDLKMGNRTAETDARWQKQLRMGIRDQFTASAQDGVQLVAMHLYRSSSRKQLKSSKAAVRIPHSHVPAALRVLYGSSGGGAHGCRLTATRSGVLGEQSAMFSALFNMEQVLSFFLSGGDARINQHLLKGYLAQLRELLKAFEANRSYSFTGSSLLFVHDGQGLKKARRPRIRMIDFAHVNTLDKVSRRPADEGYIVGLRTLIQCVPCSTNVVVN